MGETYRPKGWPRLMRDWTGMRVKLLREVSTMGGLTASPGAVGVLRFSGRRLMFETEPCASCGISFRVHLRGRATQDLERICDE